LHSGKAHFFCLFSFCNRKEKRGYHPTIPFPTQEGTESQPSRRAALPPPLNIFSKKMSLLWIVLSNFAADFNYEHPQ
jgi:hypothetical protein